MRKAYFQLHLAVLLWGFTGIFGKLIELDEFVLVWYRMIISAVALWIFLKWRNSFHLPDKNVLVKASAIGIIVCLHWITFYAAIKASNVSIALSCFASLPFFTSVMDPLMNRKKFHAGEAFLGLAVMAGIFIIFSAQQLYIKGIVLAVASAILAALFSILNKRLYFRYDPGSVSAVELFSGFVFLSLFLPFIIKMNHSGFTTPSANDWIYLLLLSIICTSFAFTLGNYALQKLDAFTCNLAVNLEPVYSIVLAILIFGEGRELNAGFFAGTLIIIGSVAIHTFYSFRKQR